MGTTAARDIVSLNPPLIKVGSPSNMHWDMLMVLREEYDGEIHISTGMSTKDEIEQIVKFWEEGKGRAKERVVLYNCTSGYPVPFEDVCLLDIRLLQQKYAHRVKAIGFSGHHLGISIDIAAYALGAQWVERHFTKDRILASALRFDVSKSVLISRRGAEAANSFENKNSVGGKVLLTLFAAVPCLRCVISFRNTCCCFFSALWFRLPRCCA